MNPFYGDLNKNKIEHLLKATPFTKNTLDNFSNSLDKDTFFNALYTKKNENFEYKKENDLFDSRIEYALRDIENEFAKVSMIHIYGYGGCGKTTYIRHLLWMLKDKIKFYDVIDYEGCTTATEPFIHRVSQSLFLHKSKNIFDYLVQIAKRKFFNMNRFKNQIMILEKFNSKLKNAFLSDSASKSLYRNIIENFEQEYTEKGTSDEKKQRFLSFLIFLDFILLIYNRIYETDAKPMVLVVDNADSLDNLAEEKILLSEIKKFVNDCSYFFGWNIENDAQYEGVKCNEVIKNTKLAFFFTTRVASIRRYKSIEPDLENIYGWMSFKMPEHYYDHKDIINHRIDYYINQESSVSAIVEELKLIKKVSEIAYHNYNFMRLFNGSFRICVERVCSILNNNITQLSDLFNLYNISKENKDAIEGVNGFLLYFILSDFKDKKIYQNKLNLSPCRKDGTISLSRIILTILREKGDRCSLLDLLQLLTPLGYNSKSVCTQVWNLCEVGRTNAWRRLLIFDVIIPSSLEELLEQSVLFDNENMDVESYSEIVICTAGIAYMEFVVPHFEFMLSRHELGVEFSSKKYQPLFSFSSEEKIFDKSNQLVYRFERKIDWVYKDVKDCCYNSLAFANIVLKLHHIDRKTYIQKTFYNYHTVGWDGEVGPKQSYESRLIFRHIGYIEKYRCFLLNKQDVYTEAERIDINERLVCRIVKYLNLYMDSHKCFQTERQNIAADHLLAIANKIKDSGYKDFISRIELND